MTDRERWREREIVSNRDTYEGEEGEEEGACKFFKEVYLFRVCLTPHPTVIIAAIVACGFLEVVIVVIVFHRDCNFSRSFWRPEPPFP